MEIAVVVVLGCVLVAVAVVMLWQERHPAPEPEGAIVYGVEDALEFVWSGLAPEIKERLRRSDVRRMLEWELLYLQRPELRDGEAVVGSDEAAAYIQDRAWDHGHGYEPEEIFAVLDLQAAYLAALGAVGDPADDGDRGR